MKGREKKLFYGRATQNTLAVTTNLGVDWKISLAKLYYVQPLLSHFYQALNKCFFLNIHHVLFAGYLKGPLWTLWCLCLATGGKVTYLLDVLSEFSLLHM